MTSAQAGLLITLALVVRSMAAPDDQRDIDRRLAGLQAEADDEVAGQDRPSSAGNNKSPKARREG